jgi:hypothetical protein
MLLSIALVSRCRLPELQLVPLILILVRFTQFLSLELEFLNS